MNLFEVMHKEYIVSDFGIAINKDVIPVDYIGRATHYEDGKVWITWNNGKDSISNSMKADDFFKLIETKRIVDVESAKIPLTEPKYKIGDLVSFSDDINGIVTKQIYDFNRNIWTYDMFWIGHGFLKKSWDSYFDEKDLININEIVETVFFENRDYKITISEK